jgi:hypothetical protein
MLTGYPVKYMLLARMPLTKWNQIKAELVEMWEIVQWAAQNCLAQTKGLG